jgi:cytochrome P450
VVVIAPYVLHRHRRLWDRPDIFDPNRFLGGACDKSDRYAYLPFGAGPRICIGSAFALQEATLVLATILANFELALADGHAGWPLQRVTLRPRGGLPMAIKRRPPIAPIRHSAACLLAEPASRGGRPSRPAVACEQRKVGFPTS